jgi:hypothetical protein
MPLTPSSASDVEVEITEARSQRVPPSTRLDYEVQTVGSRPVWLVDDGFLTWRQDNGQIELSLAREPLQPGAEPFGYFNPTVVKLEPGEQVQRRIELSWPQSLSPLWNPSSIAAPPPGRHPVSVRVGYGLSPAPDPPEAGAPVEAPVLRWQHEAVSPAIAVDVPEYSR